MTYIVHINPRPGSDERTVEVEAEDIGHHPDGTLCFLKDVTKDENRKTQSGIGVACFAPGVWNMVVPKP